MKGLHGNLVLAAQRLGWPGVVGLSLLAFAAAFYFSTIRPGQMRLEQLRGDIVALEQQRAHAASDEPTSNRERLDAFYAFFPPAARTADLLDKIFAAADKQALNLEQGDYRLQRDNVGGITRYDVILPVRGSYPQVRKFVAAALAQLPNLSLDSIQFERQKVGDSTVEAKVKFVMYLGRRR
jgi:Tfp pilus assembly protein PilO